MTEIRIPIPEMDQIIKNQEKMMQKLDKLMEAPVSTPKYDKYDGEKLMTGPEVLHYLKCGRKKLKELIDQGKIERIDAFGTRPRYKIVMVNELA